MTVTREIADCRLGEEVLVEAVSQIQRVAALTHIQKDLHKEGGNQQCCTAEVAQDIQSPNTSIEQTKKNGSKPYFLETMNDMRNQHNREPRLGGRNELKTSNSAKCREHTHTKTKQEKATQT